MKNNNSKNISSKVREIALPLARELGYLLWDVEFVKEGADKYLRITIDSETGITIDDCERYHRAIDPLLDSADPIEEAYILEVSSPGIERELKCDEHITSCVGEEVEVRLYAPLDGSKQYRGELCGLTEDGKIRITDKTGRSLAFEKDSVAKISTCFDFDSL